MSVIGMRGCGLNWRALALTAAFLLCSCALFSLYILMRRITTSSDLFEGIPTYIVAIHLLVCAGLMGLVSGVGLDGRKLVVRFASGTVGIAVILTLVGLALSLSIYERHANYSLCLIRGLCICRLDADALASFGWDAFHGTRDCAFLARLGRLVLASAILHASAVLICLLALAHLLLHTPTPVASEDAALAQLSHASLRRFLSRFHLILFPPSYEESRDHVAPAPIRAPPLGDDDAPPPYSSQLAPNSSALKTTGDHVTILQLAS